MDRHPHLANFQQHTSNTNAVAGRTGPEDSCEGANSMSRTLNKHHFSGLITMDSKFSGPPWAQDPNVLHKQDRVDLSQWSRKNALLSHCRTRTRCIQRIGWTLWRTWRSIHQEQQKLCRILNGKHLLKMHALLISGPGHGAQKDCVDPVEDLLDGIHHNTQYKSFLLFPCCYVTTWTWCTRRTAWIRWRTWRSSTTTCNTSQMFIGFLVCDFRTRTWCTRRTGWILSRTWRSSTTSCG